MNEEIMNNDVMETIGEAVDNTGSGSVLGTVVKVGTAIAAGVLLKMGWDKFSAKRKAKKEANKEADDNAEVTEETTEEVTDED